MSHSEAAPLPEDLAPLPFTCELRPNGLAGAWIGLGGELDIASAPEFRQVLEQALETARLVVIDLRGLTFMDSTGVHAILAGDARARRGGRRLALIRGPAQIERLFALIGLTNQLEIMDPRPGLPPSGTRLAIDGSEPA